MIHKVTIIKKQPMRWLCSKGNNTVAIINEQEGRNWNKTDKKKTKNKTSLWFYNIHDLACLVL